LFDDSFDTSGDGIVLAKERETITWFQHTSNSEQRMVQEMIGNPVKPSQDH